jgi:hypothetical protein
MVLVMVVGVRGALGSCTEAGFAVFAVEGLHELPHPPLVFVPALSLDERRYNTRYTTRTRTRTRTTARIIITLNRTAGDKERAQKRY